MPARYEAGKRQLIETFGLEVVEMPHTTSDAGWIARNPKARAEDLMAAFADSTISAIIASIGGDDSVRLIPYLDLGVIAANPKIFLGYSDPTTIHFACLKAGLVSFYGPTIMSGFAENCGMHDYAVRSLQRTLFSPEAIGEIVRNTDGWTVEHLDWADPQNQNRCRTLTPSTGPRRLQGASKARGRLIGGCADVIEMLKGTPWWPPLDFWRGSILFYETSEDAPSPANVLYFLRNFAQQGILEVLSGILFGRPGGSIDPARFAEYDKVILQAVDEAGLADLPVITGLDFGHTDPIFTIPCGVTAEIDCDAISLRIPESAVV